MVDDVEVEVGGGLHLPSKAVPKPHQWEVEVGGGLQLPSSAVPKPHQCEVVLLDVALVEELVLLVEVMPVEVVLLDVEDDVVLELVVDVAVMSLMGMAKAPEASAATTREMAARMMMDVE